MVEKTEIELRKWSSGAAQLRALEGKLTAGMKYPTGGVNTAPETWRRQLAWMQSSHNDTVFRKKPNASETSRAFSKNPTEPGMNSEKLRPPSTHQSGYEAKYVSEVVDPRQSAEDKQNRRYGDELGECAHGRLEQLPALEDLNEETGQDAEQWTCRADLSIKRKHVQQILSLKATLFKGGNRCDNTVTDLSKSHGIEETLHRWFLTIFTYLALLSKKITRFTPNTEWCSQNTKLTSSYSLKWFIKICICCNL